MNCGSYSIRSPGLLQAWPRFECVPGRMVDLDCMTMVRQGRSEPWPGVVNPQERGEFSPVCELIQRPCASMVLPVWIFLPRSTNAEGGFLSGGGCLPGLGFPPPSRSGRTLNPSRTKTVGSKRAWILEVGAVVGRSLVSSVVPTTEDCRLWALSSGGGDETLECMWVEIAWAIPCIMRGGYLLKSLEVTPEGFLCVPWVQDIPAQWRSGRSVASTVDFATHCPNWHWSKWMVVSPTLSLQYHCLMVAKKSVIILTDNEISLISIFRYYY